jgi:hypothetical protein
VCIPQEHGGPVIPPGTGFPFRRLLRLAGTTMDVFYPASTRDGLACVHNSPFSLIPALDVLIHVLNLLVVFKMASGTHIYE